MNDSIRIFLYGQSHELRPDYACLISLEEFFNRPLLEIADLFIHGEARLSHIADALAIILMRPAASRAELGEEIVTSGIGRTLETLQKFFLAALGLEGKTE
jgi:hypothetical protein